MIQILHKLTEPLYITSSSYIDSNYTHHAYTIARAYIHIYTHTYIHYTRGLAFPYGTTNIGEREREWARVRDNKAPRLCSTNRQLHCATAARDSWLMLHQALYIYTRVRSLASSRVYIRISLYIYIPFFIHMSERSTVCVCVWWCISFNGWRSFTGWLFCFLRWCGFDFFTVNDSFNLIYCVLWKSERDDIRIGKNIYNGLIIEIPICYVISIHICKHSQAVYSKYMNYSRYIPSAGVVTHRIV